MKILFLIISLLLVGCSPNESEEEIKEEIIKLHCKCDSKESHKYQNCILDMSVIINKTNKTFNAASGELKANFDNKYISALARSKYGATEYSLDRLSLQLTSRFLSSIPDNYASAIQSTIKWYTCQVVDGI